MTSAAVASAVEAYQSEKAWSEIEHKHQLRCLWQQVVGNRTIVMECMYFPRLKVTMMVSKHYDKPIPRNPRGAWPQMTACYVYAPIGGSTWESLDKALGDLSVEEAA